MARRRYVDSNVSRAATWAGRFALFALVVAALSVLIMNLGLLEAMPAMATFAAALICAVLAILLAFISFIGIWREGLSGFGKAAMAIFVGFGLLAYPGYLGYRASKLPQITDITTDPANPPRFDVTARLRPRESNDYKTELAQKQRAAYPDIEPMQIAAVPQAVYDVALGVTNKHKWRVVDARPPVPGRRDGTIEAVARSPVMGFRDDVVIRVRAIGNQGARVDVRSAARHAFHDFGDNAARVQNLLEEIETAVDALPDGKREGEKPAPVARPAKRGNQAKR